MPFNIFSFLTSSLPGALQHAEERVRDLLRRPSRRRITRALKKFSREEETFIACSSTPRAERAEWRAAQLALEATSKRPRPPREGQSNGERESEGPFPFLTYRAQFSEKSLLIL